MTMKRIQREISDIKKEDLGNIVLEPTDNLQVWRGVIPGPEGSVYEGGVFQVEIALPSDYPFVLVVVFPQVHYTHLLSDLPHPRLYSRRGKR
jgi:ubiquitin-conjugating enzyme E2 D/E